MADASALGAPGAAAKKTKRVPAAPTSLAAVEECRTAGCNCRSGNCFLDVTAEDLMTLRNLTEELDKPSRLVFLSGKLDNLANRGETQHVFVKNYHYTRVFNVVLSLLAFHIQIL